MPWRGKVDRARSILINAREHARRTPWPEESQGSPARVAILTVNHNTAELIAQLLYSVFRVLDAGAVTRVVVVDNKSQDRSREVLSVLAEQGLIDLVINERLPYHGPGLNRGMNLLVRAQRAGDRPVRWVWVLDSDTVVLRPDALHASLHMLERCGGVLAGQFQYILPGFEQTGYAALASLLLDPSRTWHGLIPPFQEHGAPGAAMQRGLRRHKADVVNFPFFDDEYLIHLGQGTLRGIAERGDTSNPYYEWATSHVRYHYHGNPRGEELHRRYLERFVADVPRLDGELLAGALRSSEQVRVSLA